MSPVEQAERIVADEMTRHLHAAATQLAQIPELFEGLAAAVDALVERLGPLRALYQQIADYERETVDFMEDQMRF
ncbi:hypothetical protein MPUL_00090 [Mycolicibacterium pulveris]|uniref:Uncharacterized protein n=1 Tax=Mycolicibacterium pulveris TaxID=36813 RepID=A0A7I7UD65_MYCPV|nr:hypothetical protein MPUL_00090 [Mycolicibacterium pulveris]